jgi:hypothetical protein
MENIIEGWVLRSISSNVDDLPELGEIHKCSGDENFIFPEHEKTAWSVVQRPAEEICHFVWVSIESGECSGPELEDSISNSELESARIKEIVNTLASRHPE